MNIFEHELIHVMIHIFCNQAEKDGHGHVYKSMLKNIFNEFFL